MNDVADAMLDQQAEKLARQILAVNTDYRGDLLKRASRYLAKHDQNYTANCLAIAANEYGFLEVKEE